MELKQDQRVDNFLEHHGITGMRWGIRREDGPNGRVSGGSTDYQRTKMLKRKGVKNLSTQELEEITKRLQLERKFVEMNPSKLQRGMKFVKALTTAGKAVSELYALSKTPLGQDVMKAVVGKKGSGGSTGPKGPTSPKSTKSKVVEELTKALSTKVG